MGLSDLVYKGLKHVSWECFYFGVPNFSLSLFYTHIAETSTTFSFFDETTESNPNGGFFSKQNHTDQRGPTLKDSCTELPVDQSTREACTVGFNYSDRLRVMVRP